MTCSYSPNGQFVACGGLDNICSLFNVRTRHWNIGPIKELHGHEGYVSCCHWLNDSQVEPMNNCNTESSHYVTNLCCNYSLALPVDHHKQWWHNLLLMGYWNWTIHCTFPRSQRRCHARCYKSNWFECISLLCSGLYSKTMGQENNKLC